jgi:hypothetical protein
MEVICSPRNIGLSANYKALQPRVKYFSDVNKIHKHDRWCLRLLINILLFWVMKDGITSASEKLGGFIFSADAVYCEHRGR